MEVPKMDLEALKVITEEKNKQFAEFVRHHPETGYKIIKEDKIIDSLDDLDGNSGNIHETRYYYDF